MSGHFSLNIPPQETTVWTSLRHVDDLTRADLPSLSSLKLAGLEHSSFLTDLVSRVGPSLTKLCVETVQFDVDISLIGLHCTNLEKLSIINARISVGRFGPEEDGEMLPRLSQVYLYLVQYLPAINITNKSITTGLHFLLSQARKLSSIQAPGTFLLTDNCINSLLENNKLESVKRFVITQPVSIDHRTVPLTQVSHHYVKTPKSPKICPKCSEISAWHVCFLNNVCLR